MGDSDELGYVSASELADRIRRRDVSPVDVVDAAIERIETRNPSLNAFVHQGFDEARDRARWAEQAVMEGAELGPLHGVPLARDPGVARLPARLDLCLRRAHRGGRGHRSGQDQQPGDAVAGNVR